MLVCRIGEAVCACRMLLTSNFAAGAAKLVLLFNPEFRIFHFWKLLTAAVFDSTTTFRIFLNFLKLSPRKA